MTDIHSFLQRMKGKNRKIEKIKITTAAVFIMLTVTFVFHPETAKAAINSEHNRDRKEKDTAKAFEEEMKAISYGFEGRYITFPVSDKLKDESINVSELVTQLGVFASAGAVSDIAIYEKSGVETVEYEEYEESIGILSEKVTPADSTDSILYRTYNKAFVMDVTDEEVEILCKIVEAEATSEDIYGKMLVANVVLNRVLDDEFPSTIEEVVFQKGQFSPIKDGRYYTVPVTDSTKEAVERVLNGEDYSDGALYFFARKRTTTTKAKWFDTALQKVIKYGGHEFYKNK